jgi:hypothetical protein
MAGEPVGSVPSRSDTSTCPVDEYKDLSEIETLRPIAHERLDERVSTVLVRAVKLFQLLQLHLIFTLSKSANLKPPS